MSEEETTTRRRSRRDTLKTGAATIGGLLLGSAIPGQAAARKKPDQAATEEKTGQVATEGKPFKGTFDGDFDWNEEKQQYTVSGTGEFTHLGEVTATGTVDVDWSTYFDTGCVIVSGALTLTAANGDTIDVKLLEEQCDGQESDGDSGFDDVTAGYEIVGGSGRFAEATGTGDLTGSIDTDASTFAGSLAGKVEYDAGSGRDR